MTTSSSNQRIDINQYPAIKRHLEQFRTQLEPKPNDWTGKDWPGRKPGSYKWYELQDPVDYWREFEKPKLMYQEIQYHPSYMLDLSGMLANNKVFIHPTGDLYLLGVLNSPVMWWHNWRYLPHMKDEALSPAGFKMELLPIPRPTDEARAAVETAVRRLIDLTAQQQSGRRDFLNWLRVEFDVDKPSQKLQALTNLTADELTAEVRKVRGKQNPLSVAALRRLSEEHAASITPLQALAREAEQLERQVSDQVNAAFGLTPADVQLLWDSAPPRMPIKPPQAGS